MGLIEGLADIKSRIEADEAKFSNTDYVKATWLSLKDKQSAVTQFLQALDKGASDYSEKNGLAVMAVEHSHPKNYRNKGVCSYDDEGRCWACEQHAKDPKAGWKQRTKLYVNVLVENPGEEPYVALLSSGFGKGQIAPVLLEMITPDEDDPDEEVLELTKNKFKITRSGAGLSDTSYILTQKGKAKSDPESFELFDIKSVLRQPTYAEQEAFYNRGVDFNANAEDKELVTASSAPETEW